MMGFGVVISGRTGVGIGSGAGGGVSSQGRSDAKAQIGGNTAEDSA